MSGTPALSDLQAALDEEAACTDVAGAVLALGVDDAPAAIAAHGVLDVRTGEPVRTDSLFEIGSLTKVPVASIALQQVVEGRLSLDQPIHEVVPQFQVADPQATAAITLRHLLSHTSGIDGDFFYDPGDGDDALDTFARACVAQPQLFAPGTQVSYSNVGYALTGWLIERLLQQPFAQVFAQRMDTMLGTHGLRVERRGQRRDQRAEGHVLAPDGGSLVPLPRHLPPFAHAPAGARTTARIEDVVRLARQHLAGDARLLPPEWIAQMQRAQVLAPAGDWEYGARGLGWELFGAAPAFLPGHDGATPGQAAFLRLLPHRGTVIAAAATGPGARHLFARLAGRLFPDEPALALQPPAPAADTAPMALAGRYACRVRSLEVVCEDGTWRLQVEPRDDPSGMVKPARAQLLPAGPAVLLRYDAGSDVPQPLVFVDFDAAGRPHGVYAGQRLHRRIDPA